MPDQSVSLGHVDTNAASAVDSSHAVVPRSVGRRRAGRVADARTPASLSTSQQRPKSSCPDDSSAITEGEAHPHPHGRPASSVQHAQQDDVIYLNVDMQLPVKRLKSPAASVSAHSGEDLCAEWGRMNWTLYESILDGLRSVVTSHLRLPHDAISVDKSINLAHATAVPRLILRLNEDCGRRLDDAALRPMVESYVRLVMGQAVGGVSVASSESGQWDLFDVNAPVRAGAAGVPPQTRAVDQVLDIARDVVRIIGGRTLPVPCVIESPAWSRAGNESGLKLCGRLGKPHRQSISESEEPKPEKCYIDGFMRSKRIVHLLLIESGKEKPLDVSFDEKKFLVDILRYASAPKQVLNVTWKLSGDETKPVRTLTMIEPVTAEDFDLSAA